MRQVYLPDYIHNLSYGLEVYVLYYFGDCEYIYIIQAHVCVM